MDPDEQAKYPHSVLVWYPGGEGLVEHKLPGTCTFHKSKMIIKDWEFDARLLETVRSRTECTNF